MDRQLINVSQKLTYGVSKKRLIGIILIVYGGLLFILGFDFFGVDAVYRFVTGGFIFAIGLILLYVSTQQRHRPFKRL